MTNDTVIDLGMPEGIDLLTELLLAGARNLITEAIQAELAERGTSNMFLKQSRLEHATENDAWFPTLTLELVQRSWACQAR